MHPKSISTPIVVKKGNLISKKESKTKDSKKSKNKKHKIYKKRSRLDKVKLEQLFEIFLDKLYSQTV